MSILAVDAGAGGQFSGTIRDATNTVVPKASVSSFVLTLTDAATGSVVNSRSAQSVLDVNGGTMGATDGGFSWTFGTADSALVTAAADVEEHVADFTVTGSFPGSPLRFTERILCLQPLLLCRFDDVQMQLASSGGNTIDAAEQAFVSLMIAGFTRRVEEETRRTLRKSTAGSPTVQVFSPYGGAWSVDLAAWPVDSIVSVKESLDGDFASTDALAATDYAVVASRTLRHRYRPWIEGVGCLEVRYAGGVARATGAVPADLRVACMRQVAYQWQRKEHLGVSGVSGHGGSVTLYATGDLLPDVAATIKRYRSAVLP